MIGVNEHAITSEVSPFGGMKHSGQGRENGLHALEDFQEVKALCINLGYKPLSPRPEDGKE